MTSRIEQLCIDNGMKMTDQRRIIAKCLSDAKDHPDVETLYLRVNAQDDKISIATVYRTVRLFEDAGILARLDFGDGRARYEEASGDHHDHLLDIKSGEVIEFHNAELEALQEKIAAELGFKLMDHKMELYGVRLDANSDSDKENS